MTNQDDVEKPNLDNLEKEGEEKKTDIKADDESLAGETANEEGSKEARPKMEPLSPLDGEPKWEKGSPAMAAEMDGVDKILKSLGINQKHKTLSMAVAMVIVIGAVMLVFADRTTGLENAENEKTVIAKQGGKVVTIDPDMLIRAAVYQAMNPREGVTPVDPEVMASVIQKTVRAYQSKGYIVINRDDVYASPNRADLTDLIANEVGLVIDDEILDALAPKPMPAIRGLESDDDAMVGYGR